MGKINDIDMKILDELLKDASLSVPKLSKKINVKASVVYSRIKRMVGRHLIKRFTVEVDEEILGYTVSSIIGLNIDAKLREDILDQLLDLEEVREISEVTGRFDFIIVIKARSIDNLYDIMVGRIGMINGVTHSETFIQMKLKFIEPHYTLPS